MTSFYETYAALHILIDMDATGTFATLPSERDISLSYRIEICESGDVPFATDCNCNARTCCKHLRVVSAYFARIYSVFLHQKEDDMYIPLTTDIDPSTLTPEDAQALAELNADCDLALETPLQDDETPGQPAMSLEESREAIRNDAFACVPACHRDTLRAETQARMEAAPLTKHAGFNCLLNV